MANIGDIIKLEASGEFAPYIECIVLEVSPEDGRVTKIKAAIRDERLAKMGFIIEGDDYVAVEWEYSEN